MYNFFWELRRKILNWLEKKDSPNTVKVWGYKDGYLWSYYYDDIRYGVGGQAFKTLAACKESVKTLQVYVRDYRPMNRSSNKICGTTFHRNGSRFPFGWHIKALNNEIMAESSNMSRDSEGYQIFMTYFHKAKLAIED